MLRKCNYCDKDKERSIDIAVDDYIYIQRNQRKIYYHTFCYKIYLQNKLQMNEEQALQEILIIKSKMRNMSEEAIYRDKLCKHLMELYGISYLPQYFFIKLQKINDGEYKKCSEPISNQELYEMYSNPKQIIKMHKIAVQKNIDLDNRLDWDLAIVLSDYSKYKSWKLKQSDPEEIDNQKIQNIIKDYKHSVNKLQSHKNDSVTIATLIKDTFNE